MIVDADFWRGKRVLVTGHTGFKGGWLSVWLAQMGAEVHGLALAPPSEPSFFDVVGVKRCLTSDVICDIRDHNALVHEVRQIAPEIVLHLAAQSLVRLSYLNPVETYATNVMGTVHLLDSLRSTPGVRAVVNVTTDKCYENREWVWPYRENEPMGGHDPYSNSKGCSELVTSAFRQSFLAKIGIQLASARAGNVIGGGDWATDRLLPDFLRSIDAGVPLTIRSPNATRPWQHVLEPLSGYLTLAQALWERPCEVDEGWNFGPEEQDARSVSWILSHLCGLESSASWNLDSNPNPKEATLLMLSSAKAKALLGWRPRWRLETALAKTLEWHKAWRSGEDMMAVTLSQIDNYVRADQNNG